ncbi:aldo/keto reductase [Paeniglutamicibacter sp. ABSL32-1]|uniref:aldo/keto reductase n=1 Tax=Paeniglutamicibacter quisquiliarum TaxID=2849498 RepID=UPI001C2D328C|nr:aldo/keto reductase [Paeniglutamicibacter quisquiliarum]MBV1777773.1 aldo/keto reductase [Paeniglutamicibacter quisquiliarum]
MNTTNTTTRELEIAPGVCTPMLGLGTWPLVGEEAADSVARGIANGYRHIDTAEKYGNEDAIGEGIRRSGIARDDLWVTSKLSLPGHSRAGAIHSYDAALGRMGLECLDLYLIHWPNPQLGGYVEACRGLQDLVDAGRLRAWGVSNFKATHLDEVLAAGLKPAVNQIQVDPQHPQSSLLEANAARGIATGAYSPLGRAGEFLSDPAITGPATAHAKTPAQIVLRWHLDAGRLAVPKSASDARQRENLDVFDFTLTAAERAGIDALDTGAGPRLDSDAYGH